MMKKYLHISFAVTLFMFLICVGTANAQIEKVVVEKYYVTDTTDATDTTGGKLEPGTITYRVYIDLVKGSKLKKIYGDLNHAIKIICTDTFLNNTVDGQSFGKNFAKSRYSENTVALDSWLTIGQTTKIAAKTYFGVPKHLDNDGSFIGGTNNDGGSEAIASGLLVNNDTSAGIPLITSDGMDTLAANALPTSWADYGFKDLITNEDSTIFGSLKPGTQFISYDAGLQNSGTVGVVRDSNQVLVAQLTTRGELTFELNVEVIEPDGAGTKTVKYVANDSVLLSDETVSPYLKYPLSCGCKDPDYLEYSANYGCTDAAACKTPIVFGCLDSMACNFDRNANFHLPTLCCYPGHCNDRDIAIVCPELNYDRLSQVRNTPMVFTIYPNPVSNHLTIEYYAHANDLEISLAVYNSFGHSVYSEQGSADEGTSVKQIDMSSLDTGLYYIRIKIGEAYYYKTFTKI